VWEAGTPGMGNGLILARIAGQGLKEVRNDWTGIYDHTHTQDQVEFGSSQWGTQCVWPRFQAEGQTEMS